MANDKSSTVTSSMDVSDSPSTRIPLGRDVMDRSNPSQPAIAGGSTLAKEPSSNINSGMSVTSQIPIPVAPRVDQKDLVSGKDSRVSGDYAKAAMDVIANPPNPREQMGQFPLSGRQVAPSKPVSTENDEGIGG